MSRQNNQSENRIKIAVGFLSHMLFLLMFIIGVSYFVHNLILEQPCDLIYFIFTCAMFGIIALYSLLDGERLYSSFWTEAILIVCFLVSALLLFVSEAYVNIPLWLLGGIAAAALGSRASGILYSYYFLFQAVYLQKDSIKGLLVHLICTTLICVLIPKMKNWMGMLCMCIFSGALVIATGIVVNRFVLDRSILVDEFTMLGVYCGCILVTMLFVLLLKPKENSEKDYEEDCEALPKSNSEKILPYSDTKSELIHELKIKRPSAYASAVLGARLVEYTAERMGLDITLAKAVALMTECAKLRDGDSQGTETLTAQTEKADKLNPEEAAETLRKLEVPEELVLQVKDVLSHRLNSKELVLVSVAKEVIGSYSDIRVTKRLTIPTEKIVDSIMGQALFKKTYEDSGMTLEEYLEVRKGFVQFFEEQDKRYPWIGEQR